MQLLSELLSFLGLGQHGDNLGLAVLACIVVLDAILLALRALAGKAAVGVVATTAYPLALAVPLLEQLHCLGFRGISTPVEGDPTEASCGEVWTELLSLCTGDARATKAQERHGCSYVEGEDILR